MAASEFVPGTTLEDALAQAEQLAGEVMRERGLPGALGWFVQEPSGRWVEVKEKPSFAEAKERGWTGVAVHPALLAASGTPEAAAYLALVKVRMVREAVAKGDAEVAAWHAVTVGRLVERLTATPSIRSGGS